MIAKCKICKNGTCGIQIQGLERDSNQYLDSPQISIRNYTFEHSMTLNVLYSIDSKETQTMEQYTIVPHTDIDIDEITMNTDGLKQIDHYILPTNEWFDYVLERDINAFDDYLMIYYFNINDEKFYKYINGRSVEVSVNEVIEVNPADTTIIKASVNTFILCHLEKCLFNLCLYLLENLPCSDPCLETKAKGFKLNILNRDIVWMAVNAIKYAIENGQFFRAQKILEHIQTCWGICKDPENITSLNNSGCGCN